MNKRVLNTLLLAGVSNFLFSAVSLAAPAENDSTGYLSKSRYNLAQKKSIAQTAHIQIDDDAPEKTFELEFNFSTRGTTMQDNNVQSTISATMLGVDFTWNVTNKVKAQFIGGFQVANGNSNVLYGIESTPYTGPSFDEASFSYVGSTMELSAGIVDTQFSPISSSFTGGGFAGLRETIKLDSGNFVGSFKASQSAPSSLGVGNRALDDEKSPFLTVFNLNAGYKDDSFTTNFGYTKYDFYGMTSASAADARYIGNTVYGEGNDVVFYKYKFRGQEIAANAIATLALDDKLGISGSMIKNDEAPDKRNLGWMTKAFYEYNFGRYTVRPSVTRFRFESDLMPAFFAQGGLGFLNRDGYCGEIRGILKKYNLEGYVRYLDAKEVEPKNAQSDRIAVTVGMEVKYEIF